MITQLITTQRDHLFDISKRMMQALPDAMLDNPAKPVIVSVRGSEASGKKIIFDAARNVLLGDAPSFDGKKDHDEFWAAQNRALFFINIAWAWHEFSKNYGIVDTSILRAFMAERKKGGLTFIHNAVTYIGDNKRDSIPDTADIDICLEKIYRSAVSYEPMLTIGAEKSDITMVFNKLALRARETKTDDWTRFVQIKVNNPDLLNVPSFRGYIESLAAPQPPVKKHHKELTEAERAVRGAFKAALRREDTPPDMDFYARAPVYGFNVQGAVMPVRMVEPA